MAPEKRRLQPGDGAFNGAGNGAYNQEMAPENGAFNGTGNGACNQQMAPAMAPVTSRWRLKRRLQWRRKWRLQWRRKWRLKTVRWRLKTVRWRQKWRLDCRLKAGETVPFNGAGNRACTGAWKLEKRRLQWRLDWCWQWHLQLARKRRDGALAMAPENGQQWRLKMASNGA